jgi:hypothetical protein
MPVLDSPSMHATLPARDVLEPSPRRVIATAPSPARVARQAPRSYTAVSPPAAPESSDDH